VRIELFPDRLIAQRFNFGPRALLTFAAEEKTDVDLKALFS
jgi:LemA protein